MHGKEAIIKIIGLSLVLIIAFIWLLFYEKHKNSKHHEIAKHAGIIVIICTLIDIIYQALFEHY